MTWHPKTMAEGSVVEFASSAQRGVVALHRFDMVWVVFREGGGRWLTHDEISVLNVTTYEPGRALWKLA